MRLWLAFIIASSSASIHSTIEDTSVSLYFMISRSLVLYLLILWYMFMYFSVLDSQIPRKIHFPSEDSQISLQQARPPSPLPLVRPTAPSMVHEASSYDPLIDDYNYDPVQDIYALLRPRVGQDN